jgi:hypothetical protein
MYRINDPYQIINIELPALIETYPYVIIERPKFLELYSEFPRHHLAILSNLANPSMRVVRVVEGSRREEVAEVLVDKLNWNEQQKIAFLQSDGVNVEGHYFPKTYFIHKDAAPRDVAATMFDEFSNQVEKIKKQDPKLIINENTALKIASIIIASGRLYIPLQKLTDCKHLPVNRCYPLTAKYYKNLFSGKLGFKKIQEFKSEPTIPFINIGINDLSADENFTVFDHPTIMIFKKK